MIISAHQPAYNPWLGFIHKILLSDIFVVMDDVQYEKNSFINRNKILQNSSEVMLSIPVKMKNYQSKTLRDMLVVDQRWKTKHLKSIEQSYRKSKNYDQIFPIVEKIYQLESEHLIDYTNEYLNLIVNYLSIETKIIYASSLNIEVKKLDYVCDMVRKLDGSLFVFGKQGKDYADVEYLELKGIKSYFQDYQHPSYMQLSKKFHPYMGILDLLFNEDKQDVKSIILNNNITKNKLEL